MAIDQQEILVTGANGLVGSKFIALYKDKYSFTSLDISDKTNPVDITNEKQVMQKLKNSSAKFLVHYAAFTNVTAAWEQKGDTSGIAYQVNVQGTKNLIQACKATGIHLIHISTAYVFDGNKDGLYAETDKLSPIEWYGETKALAETEVTQSDIDWTILRIDQPFRSDSFPRQDIAQRIISGLKTDTLYPQFTNHYFGPTFIDDFAKIVDFCIRTKTTGLFNASSGEKWTDYDFAQKIKSLHNLPGEIKKGDLNTYLKSLERPYQRNTAMDVSKLKKVLDFKLNSVEEALKKVEI